MRVPMAWLRELVDVPAEAGARAVGERLVAAGLEVETVDEVGADVTGPLVVGRVLRAEAEEHRNGKTVRWCRVDVGPEHNHPADPATGEELAGRGIVCGAANFGVGDLVVVALPGAVLPGGFAIAARKTYGHVSDGMICSARELGLGDDHTGIIVLGPDEAEPGADAVALLDIRHDVLDIAVTPDRGYCLSIRGVAREVATAYGLPLRDPAEPGVGGTGSVAPADGPGGWPLDVEDAERAPVVRTRSARGLDPTAPSPRWLQRRLQVAGMRPISVVVDVTNYVMLELGQPIHGYDRSRLTGTIVVRRARPGETLDTLDGATRALDPDDLVIADDSGPIGLAGVMGGSATEIGPSTTDVVVEAAMFEATGVARTARRHRLPSEASRRFERGVDPALQAAAADRVVALLVELAGATADAGSVVAGAVPTPSVIELPLSLPARVTGVDYPPEVVRERLEQVGAVVERSGGSARVTPPTWRPDLTDPHDLVEEVARLEGYDAIPSVLPTAPAGRGLTEAQRRRRRVERTLAAQGWVEAPSYPFLGVADLDALGLEAEDPRRTAVVLANPLSDEAPLMCTTLLPGLLRAARRNVGRGAGDVALYESGLVFRPEAVATAAVPVFGVTSRPSDAELAALEAGIPAQPRHLALVGCGDRRPAGWWGPGEAFSVADVVGAARDVARAAGVELDVEPAAQMPWHPGRCAALRVDGRLVGHAGELHPRVVAAMELPARTVAAELDLDALGGRDEPVRAPSVPTFPIATRDVALVVADDTTAADVEAALRRGAGDLLESVRLFDVYTGPQVGPGRRSLAYALRFRAPDRTLTGEETSAARDAAVAAAAALGAELRGSG